MSVTQWQRSSSTKSSVSIKGLSVSLSSSPCSSASGPLINSPTVHQAREQTAVVTYIVDLLRGKRINPAALPFDIQLAQLMPVGFNRANFLNGIVDAQPVEEALDATVNGFFEGVEGIGVNGFAIS